MSNPEEFNYTRDVMIEANIDYPQDFRMNSINDIGFMVISTISNSFQGEEYNDLVFFIMQSVQEDFVGREGISYEMIESIGFAYGRYIEIQLSNDRTIIYDVSAIKSITSSEANTIEEIISGNGFEIGDGFYSETNIENLYQENQERYHLAWGKFQDHLNAMQAIFDANSEEGCFGANGYLNEEDVFDANSNMRTSIINPDLLEKFDDLSLLQIQQKTRGEYRKLVEMMRQYPIEMLSQDTQFALRESIELYTRMIMGVGDRYEGGATHFDKSRSEVEFGIYFSVEPLASSRDIIQHWLEIRSQINANNFQDTTVEQRAYPFYIQTLNRVCYQKMLDLGASREELLYFARRISGRRHSGNLSIGNFVITDMEWTYGPDHYDHEFANTILGALIGMPNRDRFGEEENKNTPQSIIERLLENGDMQDIEDDVVRHKENLNLLYNESEDTLVRAGLEFPQYLNAYFGGERSVSEILQGTYRNLSIEDKLIVSSISRFLSYLEESIFHPDDSTLHELQENNARSLEAYFGSISGGGMSSISQSLYYNEDTGKYILGVPSIGSGMIYIHVPLEKIQNVESAFHYINALRGIIQENGLQTTNQSGVYTSINSEDENITWESLFEQIPQYNFGLDESSENNTLTQTRLAFSNGNIPEGYIENLVGRSISESFDQLSQSIMDKFDNWDFRDNEYINPQTDLESELYSQTDRDILELWTDINGLGGLTEVSDGNQELLMQGAKIALIIALSVAATSLTMGAAAGGVALLGSRGAQLASAMNGGNIISRGIQATRYLNNSGKIGRSIYGASMGFYAAPASWVVYPHGYSSREEMYLDLISDMLISTSTGAIGGSFRPGTLSTITDFTVLGLMTEAARIKVLTDIYHPGENFLDDQEIQ